MLGQICLSVLLCFAQFLVIPTLVVDCFFPCFLITNMLARNEVDSFLDAHDNLEAPENSVTIPISTVFDVHKVDVPQEKTILHYLKHGLSEFFFSDDPLQEFRKKSCFRKLVLAIQCVFPIFQWGSEYNLTFLKSDIISGLTIASLAIPQGISYAKLANLYPIMGLYSSFVPPLIYSVLGSSRDLAVGPTSIASLVMGSMLREAVSPEKEPFLFLQLALTATFFGGVFQAGLGFLRLGFIVDFLSRPTLTGFMGGAAIAVSLQQLKGLLGIVHFTPQMGIIPVLQSVFGNTKEWAWQTILMGFSFLALLLVARYISRRNPNLFLVSVVAPLASVILSTFISFIFKVPKHGISTIGELEKGINRPSWKMLKFEGSHLILTVKTGIVCGILTLTEGIAVGRTFASLNSYPFNGNKEMIAVGVMNIVGSCTSCYITAGAFSRSAVNYSAGCKTAASNIIMASAVLVTMIFLMPLFYYTPNAILSAIIVTAVAGLIDVQGALRLWKVDIFDFLACMSSFLGVLFLSVQTGLAIAVGISFFKILIHVTRPNTVILGSIPGTESYRSLAQYRDATRIPSILILSVEAPIYFTNSAYLQERILRCVREEEERISELNERPLRCVVLDMAAVTRIDTCGLEALLEVKKRLDKRSLQFVLANPVEEVTQKLSQSGAWEEFGAQGIFMSVHEAIAGASDKCLFLP